MPLAIAKGPFAGRALAVALMLALVGAVAPAAAQSASAPGSATSTPPSPTRFVTDGAGFLSASAQDELEQRLARYERDTGHQVLLWIGQTTGGEPIESWAVRAFKAWRVGRKGLDDGVAVFILAADRKVRIEVGYGVEDRLPDAVAARIIGDQMIPRLRAGDQDGAARAGVSGVLEAVGGETGAPREAAPAPGAPPEIELGRLIVLGLIGILVLGFIITNPQAGVDAADDAQRPTGAAAAAAGEGAGLRRRGRLGRRAAAAEASPAEAAARAAAAHRGRGDAVTTNVSRSRWIPPPWKPAIARAETRTSGEIRVSIAGFFVGSSRRLAERAFQRLGLHATREPQRRAAADRPGPARKSSSWETRPSTRRWETPSGRRLRRASARASARVTSRRAWWRPSTR